MRDRIRSLRATYLQIDPRSLGLFRIGFALLLLFDLAHRFRELDFWYTNSGLLPNHTLLWRPAATHMFSFFFMASSGAEARVGFLVCGAVYVCLLFGYRTRTMQLLAAVCRISLNSRLAMLENGGDMVMNLLALFTLALPLGQRFSVDAWRAATPGRAPSNAPVTSLAVLGLLLQFAVIYFFNALSKDGDAWRKGEAVYFALHLDKYTTELGVYMREHLPREAFAVLSYGTLAVEWLAAVLILTPVFVHKARLVAVCSMPLLHLSFGLNLNLGAFSPAMIAFYPLLLTHVHWDALGRFFARGRTPLPARTFVPRRRFKLQTLLSETALAVLIACIGLEVLNDNAAVPVRWRFPQPAWAKAVIEYPRLYQGWHMFAPTPPLTDTMIYIDAITSEGMHVDPYNEVASRSHFPAAQVVPTWLDQSQFFTMYSDRIASPDYAAYRQALLEWLVAYPQRTGRPLDCLVKFDAYWVEDGTAPLAERGPPKPLRRETFLSYVAPADSTCKPKPSQTQQQLVRTVPR